MFGMKFQDYKKRQFIGVRAVVVKQAAVPHELGKTVFFGQSLIFFGRRQQPKMKNKHFFLFLHEYIEFVASSDTECPKSSF